MDSRDSSPKISALFVFLISLLLALPSNAQVDLDKLKAMEARSIGPAGMSGRVTAIDAIVTNPDIIYVGTASGGLWKTTNGGIDFEPIFDDQATHSIGAIAIYQNNPDIIYVGTGEGNPRNSANAGFGMYKSIDGGHSWTHLGLEDSRNIHRVFVHPENPNLVYAGVQGAAWGDSEHRGVYRSTDGGANWEKILYVNDQTGIGDMVMDPANPEKLIAAMWQFRRWPWTFKSGGEGSGIYVSFDGGDSWTKRTHEDGLPEGELGRVGIGIAPSNPDVVYALVEAQKNALYRSEDGGFTFSKINDSRQVSNRPFYYNDIFVDPANENRIYHVASRVQVSDDGGKTFEGLMDDVHPDHHAWWIDPNNANLIYEGNDGGMAISRDRGHTWRFVENLPLAQFYHIRVDNSIPYQICGGLQDNGSWCGPSQVWSAGGIRNTYWEEVAFGDGFDVMIHPDQAHIGYAMSQGGNVRRFDRTTGYQKNIKPIHPDGTRLRFNWNAAIAQDPFDANSIYYGSQFVHKSSNMGDSWDVISPDLTTNDPEKQNQLDSGGLTYDVTGAENYTTIVAIAPSPLDRDVVWVGTDDGNVQVTRDGGQSWENVVSRMDDLAQGSWVPHIKASTHDAGEAFVVFEDHRRNNWEPYVYRTRDFGNRWNRIVDSDDVWGYALSFDQDPIAPNLLFLGTEFGVYFSVNDGDSWQKFEHGIPTVSAMDLVIHPRDHDLIVGTFGRSIFVVDDIRPLRAIAMEGADLLDAPLTVFEAPDAYQAVYRQAPGTRFAAQAIYAGDNRERGAMITYAVNPAVSEEIASNEDMDSDEAMERPMNDGKKKKEVKIEILNDAGEVIRTLKGPAEAGLNRTYWELRRKGIRFNFGFGGGNQRNRDAEPAGAAVLPGTYTARLSYGDHVGETTIEVKADPRMDIDVANLEARLALYDEWESHASVANKAIERLDKTQETISTVNKRIGDRDDESAKDLKKQGKEAGEKITALKEKFSGKQVQGIRRDPETVMSRLFTARSYITSGINAPDPSATIALNQAKSDLAAVIAEVNAFFVEDWHSYQQSVQEAEVSLFDEMEPLELNN